MPGQCTKNNHPFYKVQGNLGERPRFLKKNHSFTLPMF